MFRDRSPRSEPPRERRIFPVTNRGIRQALAEIRRNPQAAYLQEAEILRLQHSALNNRIHEAGQSLTTNSEIVNFTKGATWAYGLLRFDTALRGIQLPVTLTTVENGIDLRIGSGDNIPSLKTTWEKLSRQERALRKGFEQLTQYEPNRDAILAGAGLVLQLFKQYEGPGKHEAPANRRRKFRLF